MRALFASAMTIAMLASPATAQSLDEVGAGEYRLDPNHAFLTFTVVHNGLSDYIVNFEKFDATIQFNPESPAESSIEVTIDPTALDANFPGDYKGTHPDSSFETWEEALARDGRFLNTDAHSTIRFVSNGAEVTGENTGKVSGNLTFLGVTRPVTMDVTYNGHTNYPWNNGRDTIGFTATTTLSRSAYGQDSLQGPISDDVEIRFSGEFLQAAQ